MIKDSSTLESVRAMVYCSTFRRFFSRPGYYFVTQMMLSTLSLCLDEFPDFNSLSSRFIDITDYSMPKLPIFVCELGKVALLQPVTAESFFFLNMFFHLAHHRANGRRSNAFALHLG